MTDPSDPSSTGRVLVLGLDTGDGHLIETWAAAGRLPHLAGLIASGASGPLATSAETLHVSAWPSLYTGTQPGAHGVYYTHQPAVGEQGAVRFRPGQYGRPSFWELADAAHRNCFVLDAPYTHPVAGCGATQIFEWGTWAHYLTPSSQPAARLGELERACGAYPLGYEANQIGLGALDPKELVPRLLRATEARARAGRWLMNAEPWDLGVIVFSETHPAAHYLWPTGLETGAAAEAGAALDDMFSVYSAVDRAIGELLGGLTDEDTVIVVSGDGVGPNYAGWHLLPELLERLGVLVPPGAPDPEEQETATEEPDARAAPSLYGRLRGLVPDSLRASISRHLPARLRDALMKKNAAAQIDWTRTRAYALPTDLEGCIRINLRGREPEGIVEPGAEYEELCELLETELGALVQPASGRPAVRGVIRIDKALPGERRGQLPDLVVLWSEEGPLEQLSSERTGTVSEASPDQRSGTHRAPGFAIARGPGIAAGSRLTEASVLDLAPTILERLHIALPAHLEGRAWTS